MKSSGIAFLPSPRGIVQQSDWQIFSEGMQEDTRQGSCGLEVLPAGDFLVPGNSRVAGCIFTVHERDAGQPINRGSFRVS